MLRFMFKLSLCLFITTTSMLGEDGGAIHHVLAKSLHLSWHAPTPILALGRGQGRLYSALTKCYGLRLSCLYAYLSLQLDLVRMEGQCIMY
jgi:hypothetical protein